MTRCIYFPCLSPKHGSLLTSFTRSSNNSYIDSRQPWSTLPRADGWVRNFTVKWIVGTSARTISVSGQRDLSQIPDSMLADGSRPGGNVSLLYWDEQPQMQVLNCEPLLETARAEVTVARASGQVLEMKILGEASSADEAWEETFRLDTEDVTTCERRGCRNVNGTVRYVLVSQYVSMLESTHLIVICASCI